MIAGTDGGVTGQRSDRIRYQCLCVECAWLLLPAFESQ
jgi:hypothetical protein